MGFGAGTRLAVALGSLALGALAPAAAHGAMAVWHDAGPEGVAGVSFQAVAASGDVVVAVGQDTATRQAVVYRRVAGEWSRDPLPALPGQSCLTDVAVTATEAWAIGNSGADDCATAATPYAVRTGGWAALASATPAWTLPGGLSAQSTPPGALSARLTAVTLDGGAGFLGDAAGKVHPISAAGVGTPLAYPAGPDSPQPVTLASVSGLAMSTASTTLAVGAGAAAGQETPGGGDVFESSGESLAVEPFEASVSATTPVDVGAAPGKPAASVAIERRAYWCQDTGVWKRHSSGEKLGEAGTELRDAAVVQAGSEVVAALAGRLDPAGGVDTPGAVWVRTGTGPWPNSTGGWTLYPGLGSAINGVAVVTRNDIWAVGDGGNVKRYAVPPPPQDDGSTGGGDTGGGGGETGDGDDEGGAGTADGQPAGRAAASGPAPTTTVVQRPARPTPQSQQPAAKPRPKARRVMRNVRVRVMRGRLVISFRLSERARVAARALRGGRLVGLARARTLRTGPGRLVLRFRGRKAPTQLQLIVRPAQSAGRAGGR